MAEITKDQMRAAVNVVMVLSETIRELKEVPSGTLYAQLLGQLTLEQYNSTIDLLKRAKLVSEENNVLRWIGPEIPRTSAEPARTEGRR